MPLTGAHAAARAALASPLAVPPKAAAHATARSTLTAAVAIPAKGLARAATLCTGTMSPHRAHPTTRSTLTAALAIPAKALARAATWPAGTKGRRKFSRAAFLQRGRRRRTLRLHGLGVSPPCHNGHAHRHGQRNAPVSLSHVPPSFPGGVQIPPSMLHPLLRVPQ